MRDLFYGLMLGWVCAITALVGLARVPRAADAVPAAPVAETAAVAVTHPELTVTVPRTAT